MSMGLMRVYFILNVIKPRVVELSARMGVGVAGVPFLLEQRVLENLSINNRLSMMN